MGQLGHRVRQETGRAGGNWGGTGQRRQAVGVHSTVLSLTALLLVQALEGEERGEGESGGEQSLYVSGCDRSGETLTLAGKHFSLTAGERTGFGNEPGNRRRVSGSLHLMGVQGVFTGVFLSPQCWGDVCVTVVGRFALSQLPGIQCPALGSRITTVFLSTGALVRTHLGPRHKVRRAGWPREWVRPGGWSSSAHPPPGLLSPGTYLRAQCLLGRRAAAHSPWAKGGNRQSGNSKGGWPKG